MNRLISRSHLILNSLKFEIGCNKLDFAKKLKKKELQENLSADSHFRKFEKIAFNKIKYSLWC